MSLIVALVALTTMHASDKLLEGNTKILFLGDSITQNGKYVSYFDAWLVNRFPDRRYTVINAGVSSETVSGLSEEGHAGGRFPRPDLHERLERVMEKTRPDLIIACYGMNCGIYQQLEQVRFARFKDGILRLRAAAIEYEADILHLTPPIYDNKGQPGFDYDDVLAAYSEWLVQQREAGWHVADLHSDMRAKIDQAKKEQPGFSVQRDKVHPNAEGHWMMAQSLIAYFGDANSAQLDSVRKLLDPSKLAAITRRMQLYQKAIHAETNPLRPGVPKGGTLESAEVGAKELEAQIYMKP